MREVPFSVPVSGIIRLDGNSVTVVVNRAETSVLLWPEAEPGKPITFGPGKTMYDVILEAAREVVRRKGVNRFSAPELFHEALDKYPALKRNSFTSRVIASTPDHSSYKHYASRRDYFSHIGPGLYKLNDAYRVDKVSSSRE